MSQEWWKCKRNHFIRRGQNISEFAIFAIIKLMLKFRQFVWLNGFLLNIDKYWLTPLSRRSLQLRDRHKHKHHYKFLFFFWNLVVSLKLRRKQGLNHCFKTTNCSIIEQHLNRRDSISSCSAFEVEAIFSLNQASLTGWRET